MSTTSAISDLREDDRMPDADHVSPQLVLRVNAYRVLAWAFARPDEMDESQIEAMRASFGEMEAPLADLGMRTADAWQEGLVNREVLAVAFARLFLGPFELLAPPYASLYLDPQQGLMGEISQCVARHYVDAGLSPSPGPNEVPDHITRELEFMYYVAFQEAITGDRFWAERQRRFWTGHLSRWLPDFAEKIATADCHAYYNDLARLLLAFSKIETASLGAPS